MAALRLHLAGGDARERGFLGVGSHADHEVPFTPGEELPFEDGAAETILVGRFAAALPAGVLLALLIEARRVLRPGGILHADVAPPPAAEGTSAAADDLAFPQLALLCGLDVAEPDVDAGADRGGARQRLRLTKRDRVLRGDPLVSIVIPAYNPRYFAACLDSAIAQTYRNVEIVVCDDSPGGEIGAIAASGHARPVRYERNAVRLGPRANFVRCFERARGEFVKFLCDDDLLAPTCVSRLLEAFRAPDVTLATSRRHRIGPAGELLSDMPATTPIVARDTLIAGHTLANAMLMAGLNTLGEPSTALFRKDEFARAAPHYFAFRGDAGHGIIDMVMWTGLLLKGNAVYLAQPQSSFRSHPEQRQNDASRRERNHESIRSLQRTWLSLGLAEHLLSDVVVAKPFPPGDADWNAVPLLGFAARRVAMALR